MKEKIKISNLIIKNNAYYFLVSCAISVILMGISFFILSNLPTELTIEHPHNLDNNILYISGELSHLDTNEFDQIFTYSETIDLENYSVQTGLDFSTFTIDDNVSGELISQLSDWEANSIEDTKIYPDYTSEEVKSDLIPNDTYQIPYFLAGSYPINDNEVVIGELIANLYLTDYNLVSYDDLVGKEISLKINNKDYNMIISGVSAGNKDILASSEFELFKSDQPKKYSYYKEFTTKQEKEIFIDDNQLDKKGNGIIYYESRNYNILNILKIINIISLSLIILIFCLIMYTPLKELQFILRYYGSQTFWYYTYLYPIIFLLSIIIVFIFFKYQLI